MNLPLSYMTETFSDAPSPALASSDLEYALRSRIAGEVRFDAGSRAVYSADASNYRQAPIGLVIPKTADDIVAAVALCPARETRPVTIERAQHAA